MSASSQVKVLVCGDVRGQFDALFKRVTQISAKVGAFEMLLCVGEFFGVGDEAAVKNAALLSGELPVPISTYIMAPCSQETARYYPEDGRTAELAPNLTYLGHHGQLTTASGITVAYVGGIEAQEESSAPAVPYRFDEDACDEVCIPTVASTGYMGVDILLTSCWPAHVGKYSQVKPKEEVGGSELISKVAASLKPRYHFAGLAGVHYERQPYRNHRILQETTLHTSRFIGLSYVGNKDKAKFLYAFNTVPMKKLSRQELTEQPPDASEFPYAEAIRNVAVARQQRKEREGRQSQFFFNTADGQQPDQWDRRANRKRGMRDDDTSGGEKRGPFVPAGPCWFCLSSPDVAKRLVVSVGDACYVAMPKGGLVDDHVLILPVGHIQSLVSAPDDVRKETERFKSALSHCFAGRGQCCVFFERNYKTQHLQIQAVPVPVDKMGLIKDAFKQEAEAKVSAPDDVRKETERFKSALSHCFAGRGQCCVFFERNYKTQHLQIQAVPVPVDKMGLIKDAFKQEAEAKVSAPDDVRKETERFKSSLSHCFAGRGQCCVFFERNYKTQHLQIQAVPVPVDKMGLIKDAFKQEAEAKVSAPDDVRKETERFKSALSHCFAGRGQCCVFFERNYKTQHLQIQAVPVPVDKMGLIKDAFKQEAEAKVSAPDDVRKETERFKSSLSHCFAGRGQCCVFFERNYKTQHLQIQAVPVPVDKMGLIKDAFKQEAEAKVSAPDDVRKETERFKSALSHCFAGRGQCCVFFERNYKTQHLQIQAVPVPVDKMGLIKDAFKQEAEAKGIELLDLAEDEDLWEVLNEGVPYFFAELPDGSKLFTRQMRQFPLQFGREVLASETLLNLPDKVDWRACSLTEEEETENTKKFRAKFAKYDFTDEDDE